MSTGAFDLGSYGAEIVLNTSQFEQGMENAETQMNNAENQTKGWASNIGTIAAGAVAGLGIALAGVGIAGFKMADDLDKSLNGLQASTGATQEEMKGMEESLKNIYNANLGESFDDIAQSMALVKQNTGLTGEELEKTTKNALMLRDTFEMDVAETTNAANSLMKQFGITSDEAFNLIAQGAQNGANKNGDLIDTLNEYAPQFQAMGFSAEEFTNVLIDGAQNGAFSIDKVGDAMKEFNIRSKDMSTTSVDAFQSLGLNAEQMSQSFAAGGDTAQQAFNQVMTGLNSITDPVEKNRIGVELFGTQFEDLEAQGIAALGNIGTNASLSKDALGQINEVKYDSFGEALSGIGRNITTELLVPIGDKVLPKMVEFSDWITDHMPEIKEGIQDAIDTASKAYDGLTDSVKFVKDNMNILLPVIVGITGAIGAQMIINTLTGFYNAWRVATTAQTTAQWLLNVALNANPLGLIALAIGALIGVGVLLWKNWDTITEKASDLWLILQDKFAKIKKAITNPIEDAKDTVMGLVDRIKGAFDFKWKLPDLKLPHVSVDMKENKWGIPYPDFDVKWYANGGFFDKPELAVLGDAGQEAAVPLVGKRMDPFADAVYRRIEEKMRFNATQNQSSTTDNSKHYNLSNVTIRANNPMELFQGLDNAIRSI
ncbi:phage tail tape measure protein [Neobacillus sp. 3P2-tot-E-2]|uniref:phage tail tape measure protein n=1 Tax=Neobacillus sp. 3P2-tot-E-2 TaxID=3132212 RepID=UPI0039A3D3E1